MSDAHEATLLKANEAIIKGDFDGFLVHCTDDTVWTFVGEQTLRGKQAVRRWMVETYKEPPDSRVDRLVAEGDAVVVIGEAMLADDAGKKARNLYCDVRRFEGGKLAELHAFVSSQD